MGPVTAGSAIGPTTVPIAAIPTPITLIGADAIGAAGIIVKRPGNNDRFEDCSNIRAPKADADIAHVLTMDAARCIASNIAKLPTLLGADK